MGKVLIKILPPLSIAGLSSGLYRIEIEERIVEMEPISQLLNRLSDKYGADFQDAFLNAETKQVISDIVVLINNHVLNGVERQEAQLKNGDTVTFMTPVDGG